MWPVVGFDSHCVWCTLFPVSHWGLRWSVFQAKFVINDLSLEVRYFSWVLSAIPLAQVPLFVPCLPCQVIIASFNGLKSGGEFLLAASLASQGSPLAVQVLCGSI